MSGIRVLVGTKKGAFILTRTAIGNSGRSTVRCLRDGSCTISRDRPSIRIGCTRHKPAVGSGKSSSVRMTAAKRGINRAPPGDDNEP